MKNLYEILGVDKNADDKIIKKKYRELTKKYHPDNKETGDSKLFAEINQAYEILSNKEKRLQYDTYGTTEDMPHYQDDDFGFGFSQDDIEELLRRQGFRTSNRQQRNTKIRGQNLRIGLNVKLSELTKNKDVNITYKRNVKCNSCNGTGSKDGHIHKCPVCNGTGVETIRKQNGYNVFIQQTTCRNCMGTGEFIPVEDRCPNCYGTKFKTSEEKIKVTIDPHNLDDIVIPNKGNESPNGGENGNLIVVLNIINDSKEVCGYEYVLQDSSGNLGLIKEIGYAQMILGDKITLKNIRNEDFVISIPSNTVNGKIYKYNNEGLTRDNYLLVQVKLKDNSKITDKEKEILEKLRELESEE